VEVPPRLSAEAAPRPPLPGAETHTRRLLREALALLIFAVSIFLFLSLAAGRSLCGPIGESLAGFFQDLIGTPASYLLTGLLFTLGVFNLLDRPLGLSWLSSAGLVLSVVALATLVAIPEIDNGTVASPDVDPREVRASGPEAGETGTEANAIALEAGGVVGGNLAFLLVNEFHTFGAMLLTITIGFIALMFATDRWVLKAVGHLLLAVYRFMTAPAPPPRGRDEDLRFPRIAGESLLRASEPPEPLEPPEPTPERPRPAPRKKVVMVARSGDIPEVARAPKTPAPAPAPAGSRPKADPAPASPPRAVPAAPAPAPKPPPKPIIHGTDATRTAAAARKKKAGAPEPPIKPPVLRAFAGLPADSDYVFPSLDLLDDPPDIDGTEEQAAIQKRADILVSALNDFKITADVVEISKGPVITMYELQLAPGTKVKQITNLSDDLAMRLKASSVRIVAPIPGKSTMGVEVPNLIRDDVRLRDLVLHPEFNRTKAALPLLLGKDGQGRPLIEDLAQMPHLLVAGATGAGKSVCLNSIILSIMLTRRPEEAQLILLDPKMVELSQFRRIPHLMTPVVTDMRRAPGILEWAVQRMDERYSLLHDAGVRQLVAYNKLKPEERAARLEENGRDPEAAPPYLPYLVIIVDEMADLMMTNAKDSESHIVRLAQKSRAVGIHLVMATQRPSADVITGLIKANMPTRIAFKVSSRTDSRIVVDQNGAEKLLGMGDMLYLPPRTANLVRCQATFVSDEEVKRMVKHATQLAKPRFDEDLAGVSSKKKKKRFSDELYEEAVRTVLETGRGSTSLLQRKFQIGYTRAARLVDVMAQDGILGKYKGSQAREVLVSLEEWERTNQGGKKGP
jgi:S-DNA-T family DNA segregation ATPase FtsK/SpoIIIE